MAECDVCVASNPFLERQQLRIHDTDICRVAILGYEVADQAPTLSLALANELLEGGFVKSWDTEARGVIVLAPRVFADNDVVSLLADR